MIAGTRPIMGTGHPTGLLPDKDAQRRSEGAGNEEEVVDGRCVATEFGSYDCLTVQVGCLSKLVDRQAAGHPCLPDPHADGAALGEHPVRQGVSRHSTNDQPLTIFCQYQIWAMTEDRP